MRSPIYPYGSRCVPLIPHGASLSTPAVGFRSKAQVTTAATSPNAQESVHACPVCSDDGHLRLLCLADGFTVYVCATCHAEHAWPLPTPAQLKAYYDRPEW